MQYNYWLPGTMAGMIRLDSDEFKALERLVKRERNWTNTVHAQVIKSELRAKEEGVWIERIRVLEETVTRPGNNDRRSGEGGRRGGLLERRKDTRRNEA